VASPLHCFVAVRAPRNDGGDNGYSAAALRAAWIARHTRSGVAGMSSWVMPSGASASSTAFIAAGRAPTEPASPAPLTPSGLVLAGTSWLATANDGRSVARGIA